MKIYLEDHHKEHCRKIGHPDPPSYIETDLEEYYKARDAWSRTLRHHKIYDEDEVHKRAIAHLAWQQHSSGLPGEKSLVKHIHRVDWKIVVLFFLLLLTILWASKGHAQFSYPIQTNNQGSQVGFHKSYFILNCSTNMTCADNGTTLTLSSTGGGAATGYQTIQNAGAAIAQETVLNWTAGITCVDNAGATRSDCALKTVAAVSHQFFNAVTAGGLVGAQPAFGDLSGTATSGQLPTVPVSKGGTNNTSAGTNGQVLICDGVATCAPGDPIVSYNYVNLWTAQDVTVTRTSPAVRVSTFGSRGSLFITWAGITGSPATCTIQLKSGDSAGNFVNNGSAISVAPANGSTEVLFTPAAAIPTQAQAQAVFACGTYPTAGTLTLELAPSIEVDANVAELGGTAIDTNSGTKSAGTQRVVLATDQPTLTNPLDFNIKNYGGSAVGAGNAVHVQPGTAATWDISDRTARLLGNVRAQDGSGNALTTNSTTFTAKFALDTNLLGSLGTAFSTAGKVDVKGADGDVFVRQTTAANLKATVNAQDGAGNALTTNSTTYTAKFALDGNLLGTLGTAFSTAGKVDVKAADGDVFVRQATSSNLNADVNVKSIAGSAVSTAAAGTQLVGVADGAGNKITTNSSTYTSKFAFDTNLLGTLGTAFSTAGKVDVKAADGDVFVRQATAANLNATVVGTLTDNNAAPAATNAGALTGIARTDYRGGTAATAGRLVAPDVGTDGLLHVATLPDASLKRYKASSKFAASSTTDNWRISGNASNTVLVTNIAVTCTQTTAGMVSLVLRKESAAVSGGTAATVTNFPIDSNKGAASSVVQSFTGTGPTVGTLVGDIDDAQFGCMASATATPNDIYITPTSRGAPVAVLRGVAEGLAINFGGAITGGNLTVSVEWTEVTTITP